ncbi:MAG: ABC transporter ATP-binding protein [Dysgonomonas sp.]
MKIVSATGIYKSYKDVQALTDINFEVESGEIFGIIGPDGAGKTSLFRILTTLILADKGTAQVNGCDVVKDYTAIRSQIGYMPGRFSLYQDMTIEENMNFFATMFGTTVEENYDLVKDIYQQIEPFKNRKAGNLSGGMKQKLALSCALIHRPTVLFLDEPTTGVDPISRKELWQMLKNLKKGGITIIVSTPYMDEASLCDRIALIKDGKFYMTDTPENITKALPEQVWTVKCNDLSKILSDLRAYKDVNTCYAFGNVNHISVKEGFDPEELKKDLENKGYNQLEIKHIDPTVEDCFLYLENMN